MTAQDSRNVTSIITSHRQQEGAGFIVRRPFPRAGLEVVDPFLLLDEMGPIDYAPGKAIGAPDHPHRGFETISYILEGEVEHEDSAGHRGTIGAGDVQWMTAGAGIVHSEMPSRRIQTEGGRVHGFQIWVNLPANLKMTRPRYQGVPASKIPHASTHDGLAEVRVIAGEALGVNAVIDTNTPVVYQDWTLQAGADVTLPIARDHRVMVYVFQGKARLGDDAPELAGFPRGPEPAGFPRGKEVIDGQLAILGEGDVLRLRADEKTRFLVLGGVPMNEPVARYGPFVMNTQAELQQAVRDFQSGRMGEITRTALGN